VGTSALAFVSDRAIFALLVTLGITSFGVVSCWAAPPAPAGTNAVGVSALLARGALAAMAIGGSVWLAGLGSPLLAGMASVFPAIFMTTMVSLWLAQGESVPVGAVGPMILGSTSVAVFALVSVWSVPSTGILFGIGLAWVVSVGLASVPAALWLRSSAIAEDGPKPGP
jgi:hypothetical protein